jgi:outer membrane protein
MALSFALTVAGPAWSLGPADPWHVDSAISTTPTAPMLGDGGIDATCPARVVSAPLGVFEAIERALCSNPKTQGAWADVKAAAAALGSARAAYLPTLNGSLQDIGEHVRSTVKEQRSLNSAHAEHVSTQTLSLTWVLFDFGGRSADINNAKHLLEAAKANQDVALQTAYINAAKDYYAAVAGMARVDAMKRVEASAYDSFRAAGARVDRGAAAATDMLQAKTAYTSAEYNRVKAEATYRSATGALAVDMGLSPDTDLALPPITEGDRNEPRFLTAIHELIAQAEREHPTVLAAQAQWEAARAKVRSVRAQGLPTLSFIGQSSRNNQPTAVSLGQPELASVTRDNYIGVKLDVPLFEGQGRGYKVRQAQAQMDSQQDAVFEAQRQVATSVWSNYQDLLANTENLTITADALDAAREAFKVMQYRYHAGIGNILELLNAQQALAKAEEQHIEAETDWYTSKLQLAASLGNIELMSVTTYE